MKRLKFTMVNDDVHWINKEMPDIQYLLEALEGKRWMRKGEVVLNVDNIASIEVFELEK